MGGMRIFNKHGKIRWELPGYAYSTEPGGSGNEKVEVFYITETTDVIKLEYPPSGDSERVYLNGLILSREEDYSLDEYIITFNYNLENQDIVKIIYKYLE